MESTESPPDTVLPEKNSVEIEPTVHPQDEIPDVPEPSDQEVVPQEVDDRDTSNVDSDREILKTEIPSTSEVIQEMEPAVPVDMVDTTTSDRNVVQIEPPEHHAKELTITPDIDEYANESSILEEVDSIIKDIPKAPKLSLVVSDAELEAEEPTPKPIRSPEMVRSPTPPPKDDYLLTPRPLSTQSVRSLTITSSEAISETDSNEEECTETECDSDCDSDCDGVHEYTDSSSTNESLSESEDDDVSTKSVPSKRNSSDLESIMLHLSKLNSPELDEQRADDPTIRRKAKIEKSLQPVYETLGRLEGSVDPEILESVYRSLGTLKREAGRPSSVYVPRDSSMEVQISNEHMLFKENDFEADKKDKNWMQKLKKRMSFGFLSRKKDS
jgi:hypothetical protein